MRRTHVRRLAPVLVLALAAVFVSVLRADDGSGRSEAPDPSAHVPARSEARGSTHPATKPAPRPQAPPTADATDDRPNIVLVLSDDQTAESMRVMPNTRRLLGAGGVTFANSFAATPLCCPSRATLLTGQHSRHTGVFDNHFPNGGVAAFDDSSTLGTWLQDAGYTTAMIGKYLNGYEADPSYVPPGWDDWHGFVPRSEDAFYDYALNTNGTLVGSRRRPDHYLTEVLAERAERFLSRSTGPFFLLFAPYAPHDPAEPAPRDTGAFAGEPPFRPPSFDKPVMNGPASILPQLSDELRSLVDGHRQRSLESLLSVDRAVAAMARALERRGVLDNTLVLYTSDNGLLHGEHRIVGKIWPYEASIRVPLLVRGPGIPPGRRLDELVSNIDLASTVAEVAGITPRLPQSGHSLMPLLRGESVEWRRSVHLEYLGDRDGNPMVPPRYRGVRTSRYKLIVYEDGSRELYDLEVDPHELLNLAGLPGVAAIERRLAAQIEEVALVAPGP